MIRMNSRYLRMIEFFQQTKKPENVKKSKKELEYLKAVYTKMRFYYELDFKNFPKSPIILEAKKEIKYLFIMNLNKNKLK